MLSPVHLLVCDDVRFELRGKVTFVGTYGHSINVEQFPAELRFGYRIELRFEKPGPVSIAFQILGPGDTLLVQAGMQAEVINTEETSVIPVPQIPLFAEKPGTYKVQLVLDEKSYDMGTFELRHEKLPAEVSAGTTARKT